MTTTTITTRAAQQAQNKSKRITTIIHIVLLGLLLFPFMNITPPEPKMTTAVVVDFREFKSAAKKSSTKKSTEASGVKKEVVEKPEVKETPKPKPTPVPAAKKKPVLTDEKSKEKIKTKPTVADKPVEAPLELPKDEAPEKPTKETPKKETKPAETAPAKPTEAKEASEAGNGDDTTGSTSGEGEGQSGSSTEGDSKTDGVADEGDNGMDFSGNGIFNRRVIKRADVKKITNETGKIVINLCVNPSGRVVYSEYNEDLSTIETMSVIRKALKVAQEYRFERDYTAPKKQCGKLSFIFDIEEETPQSFFFN